jgi:hypothetical protein
MHALHCESSVWHTLPWAWWGSGVPPSSNGVDDHTFRIGGIDQMLLENMRLALKGYLL